MEEQKSNDYYGKQEEIIATNTDDDIDYTKRSILEKDRQMRELVTEFGDTIIKALNESNNALDIELNRNFLKQREKLQKISLDYQKTIEEQENQIKALNESNNALDIEIRKLDRTLNSIHQSITWRSLTPLKRRYDHFFHKVKSQSKLTVPIID